MITKNVSLYLGDGFPVRVPVSQFDTMWQFVFTIIHNSQPWQIPTGATAVLNGKKPDGNVFAFSGTIANNTVTVDADVQMTAVAGPVVCELSILSDGKVVGTANFILDVEAAPKSPDDVSSESTLPAYAELLGIVSGDIESAVDGWLNAHSSQIGGLSNAAKVALLALLEKVAYIDEDGQQYWDALHDALYPPAGLASISAVFNQGSHIVKASDSLDSLKQYLTVTAHYDDSTTATITNYTLSGTLAVGTSAITVSYGGKTTTFSVTVSENRVLLANYDFTNGLTDSVGGKTVTLAGTGGATQDENGLHFANANSYATIPDAIPANGNITIEMDIAEMSKQFGSVHGRLLMWGSNCGVIYRSTGAWQAYAQTRASGSWVEPAGSTDAELFSGKTLVLRIFPGENVSLSGVDYVISAWSVQVDGNDVISGPAAVSKGIETSAAIPAYIGQSTNTYFNVTVTGLRIYEGVE